jgi:hypothetical protein
VRTAWDKKLAEITGTTWKNHGHETSLVIRRSGATTLRSGRLAEITEVTAGPKLSADRLTELASQLERIVGAGPNYGSEPDHHMVIAYYARGRKFTTSISWNVEMGTQVMGNTPDWLRAFVNELLALRTQLFPGS